MPTVIDLQERRNQSFERMKEIIDLAEAEDRELTQEEKNSLDTCESEIRSFEDRIKLQEKLERTPASAPAAPTAPIRTVPQPNEDKMEEALDDWLRHGNAATPEHRELLKPSQEAGNGRWAASAEMRSGMSTARERERRALATMSMTAGGATVPIDNTFAARLEVAMSWYGGMREVATIITTSTGADLPYPTASDIANSAVVVEENGAFGTTTDPTFAAIVMKAYKYSSGIVLVPWELLQDSAVDIPSYLAGELGTRIGRTQNLHFTNGTGASSPTGLMQKSVQGRAGATGTSTSTTFDELILLEHAVNIAYRRLPGVGWMFHDQTLRDIRRIKDGEGRFIWQSGDARSGAPNTLLGYRYTINNDMPTMAASVNSIVFGALDKYLIRQVRDVQIIRLDELYAGNGRVGFLAWARADGHLLDAGGSPVQHFTNSAS